MIKQKSIKMITLQKYRDMKGVTILKDEKTNRKILQADVSEIAKNPSKFEDLIDAIVAEERKDEKKISWESAKKQLKKTRKI